VHEFGPGTCKENAAGQCQLPMNFFKIKSSGVGTAGQTHFEIGRHETRDKETREKLNRDKETRDKRQRDERQEVKRRETQRRVCASETVSD